MMETRQTMMGVLKHVRPNFVETDQSRLVKPVMMVILCLETAVMLYVRQKYVQMVPPM